MKNRTLPTLLILLISGFIFGQNLVVEYQLNRNLKDNLPSSNNLTTFSNGNGVVYADGRSASTTDSAVRFDRGQGLVCTKPIDNRLWAGTAISLWVRNIDNGDIFKGAFWGCGVFIDATGDVGCYFGGSQQVATMATGVNFKDGKWHHIVAQNTGAITELYIDGTKRTTSAEQIQRSLEGDTKAKIYLGLSNIETNKLSGEIDNVQVYDDEIDQTLIDSLYGMRNLTSSKQIETVLEVLLIPNPATDVVEIKNLPGEAKTAEIYSIEGKLVATKEISSGKITISDLPIGQFLIRTNV